jgi:TolB-like protein/class 3 adenylate cyclase
MSEERDKRKLSAVLSADVKGYSRLMGEDESGTVRTLKEYREIMAKLIQRYRGRVVDSPGDNLLAEFASVVDAVDGGVEIQKELKLKNDELPEDRRMEFRIGVNLGDVLEDGDSIYGDGVNITARVESLADGGGICISGTAYDQIGKKLPFGYEYLGEQTVKNIEKPVRIYRVLMEPEAAGKVIGEKRFLGRISRRAAIAAIITLIAVAGGLAGWALYLYQSKRIEPASLDKMAYPLPDKPSIAVLPFDNMSADPDQEYFSDGITEEIITALSKMPKLFVIARNSTFSYKGKPVKVNQVAEELGVRYVLEGSVRKAGDRVRITAQLIDALTGHHLWAERYDRNLKDIFALQDEITKKVITALQVTLTEGEQARIMAKGTDNLEAYLLYLQAVGQQMHFNKVGVVLSRQMAEKAIALDSKYAAAYRTLALSYWLEVPLGMTKDPRQSISKAMEFTQKSLALDKSSGGTHSLLGWLYTVMRRHDKGISECERGVALEPNSAWSHYYLGSALRYAGKHEEAILMYKDAIRLNPIPPSIYYQGLTNSYSLTGQHEGAITAGKKAIHLEPNNQIAHAFLAAAYSLGGREEESHLEAKEVLRINPKFSVNYLAKTIPYKNPDDRELIISGLLKAGLK